MSDTATEAASIQVRDLEVRRGRNLVLPGISLEVRGGMVTGLLGPSGSGKTTLMRSIVGVQVVARGQVRVLDEAAGSARLRKRVAYMTQAPSIYGDLTVRENLRYFAHVLRVRRAEIDSAIAAVNLEPQADQVVSTLSGGERSRTSLAVALLGDAEVLVLDEPTVGLDPVLRQQLWRLFHRLGDEGRTILVSTHVMDEAERCDHLILMREGRVVASAAPRELLEKAGRDTLEEAFITFAEAS